MEVCCGARCVGGCGRGEGVCGGVCGGARAPQKINFPFRPLTLAANRFCHVVEAPASRVRRELSVLWFHRVAAVRALHS